MGMFRRIGTFLHWYTAEGMNEMEFTVAVPIIRIKKVDEHMLKFRTRTPPALWNGFQSVLWSEFPTTSRRLCATSLHRASRWQSHSLATIRLPRRHSSALQGASPP